MSDIRSLLQTLEELENDNIIELYDSVDLELSENFVIETGIVGFTEDGIILEADSETLDYLKINDIICETEELEERMIMGTGSDASASGSFKMGEAEYQGRKVPLGKPMKGDVAKSKVYVRKPNGKVVKVNFGDKNMRIKKNIPGRRKSFRARHNCANPGPRWKARYWSCRAW